MNNNESNQSGLCYSILNYTDTRGNVRNIIQIYQFRYSPLYPENHLTPEQEQYIKHLGFFKLMENTYRHYKKWDLAEFNEWAGHNGLTFSNGAFVYLEEHLYEIGGVLFEPDHKPRINPNKQRYDEVTRGYRQAERIRKTINNKSSTYSQNNQSAKNTVYNPRRKYTGSEDETAGLWYDFD